MVNAAPALDALIEPVPAPVLGIGETAAMLAEALADGDLLFAAADASRAERVAHALAAAAPGAAVLLCPGSDALPDDDAPASPANVGPRVAALRRLRMLIGRSVRPRSALVTTGEALARTYAAPAAFDAEPPRVDPPEPIDLPALFDRLVGIGYLPSDRVDEPGEAALQPPLARCGPQPSTRLAAQHRRGTRPRDGGGRDLGGLPTEIRSRPPSPHRRGGAGPLEPSGARPDRARRFHSGAGGERPDRRAHAIRIGSRSADQHVWRAAGLTLDAAVNISALLPADRVFMALLAERIEAAPVNAAALTFEVTESAAMRDPERAIAALERIAALGIGLSNDDYGTGQSTLSYLKRLLAREIKIDKSFVLGLEASRADQAMVRSTIALAHELGFKVVAEGVENEAVLDLLTTFGCDTAQGWHIGKPMPSAALIALLTKQPEREAA